MPEWRVYGCGSASSGRSLQSCHEFAAGADRLPVDFGNGALRQLCRREGSIHAALDAVRHLALTHGHHDHIAELTRHCVAWRYTPGYGPGPKVNLYATGETLEAVRKLLWAAGSEDALGEIYTHVPIEPGKRFPVGGLTVTPFATAHTEGSVGLRIEAEGLAAVFTSDTRWFEGLADACRGADLLIAEASFLDGGENPMHMSLDQAAQLAADAGARALALTHFYPDMEAAGDGELAARAAKRFGGPVFVPRDGLALRWTPDKREWTPARMFGFD